MNEDTNVTYMSTNHADFYEGGAQIDSFTAERAALDVRVDLACFFGGRCASGGGAEVADHRTVIEVDTLPLADAIEFASQGLVAAVFVCGAMVILRDAINRRWS